MTATTIEQSKRLTACGVSTDTADLCRMGWELTAHPYKGLLAQWVGDAYMKGYERTAEDFDLTPSWSLSALLTQVLPALVYEGGYFSFDTYMGGEEPRWRALYAIDDYSTPCTYSPDPIETCVLMVEELFNSTSYIAP